MNSQSKFRFDGKTVPLASLCIEIVDCHHSTPNWTENGKLVIRNFNVRNGRLHLDDTFYTDEETFKERIRRSKPEPGDLIITREAPMGEVCLIPENVECCLGQRMVLIKPDSKKVSSKYLLYALQSEFVQKQIQKSDKTGSIVSNLRIPVLKELLIPSFDIKIEQQIGEILDAIVSKIELNNRINAELEAMAKTIYDYWFVQFDFPDKNGKPYKASGGKMVGSEELKREIPEGWDVGTVNDLGEIIGGSTPSTEDEENFANDGTPWITPKDLSLNAGNKYITKGEACVTKRGIEKASLKVMPEGTILLSSRAPIGYMAISREPVTTNQGFKNIVPNKGYSTEIVYYLIKNLIPVIEKNSSGSTFKEISGGVLKSIKVLLPHKNQAHSLTEILSPIFKKQNLLELENQKLTELRDWILPMLMNGQVKIKDAEGELAMAAEPKANYGRNK